MKNLLRTRESYIALLSIVFLLLSIGAVAGSWRSEPGQKDKKDTSRRRLHQVAREPAAKQPKGISPRLLLEQRKLHDVPALTGTGLQARRNTQAFIAWAGQSSVREHDDVVKAIADARNNKEIAASLCEQLFASYKSDHSKALIILSLLGEMRNAESEQCLRRFVNLPLPTRGRRTAEDHNVQATSLASLQAKAVEGLAYLNNSSGDEEVLNQVQKHPSLIVRAAAINAYLYNHKDSAEARRAVSGFVRKGEEIFLDRIRKGKGESKDYFNRKLATYLKAHPDVKPPAPQHQQPRSRPKF